MSTPRLRHFWRLLECGRWTCALIAASFGVTLLAALYLHQMARENARGQLLAIAELKAQAVEHWIDLRRNTTLQPPGGNLSQLLLQWQTMPAQSDRDAVLRDRLMFYVQREPEVSRVALHDAQGRLLVSTSPAAPALQLLDTSPSPDGLARLIDFHPDAQGRARLAFYAPLSLSGGAAPLGFVLFEVDPVQQLFPYLQHWPGMRKTAEVTLVRVRDGFFEFLSPLRHSEAEPLSLNVPVSAFRLPDDLAKAMDQASFGRDYRDERVLRVVREIRGTPWLTATKIDVAEIYADARWLSAAVALLMLLLLLCSLALLRTMRERVADAARREQEGQDMALLRAYIDAVPESLLLLARSGRIILCNRTAAERIGLSADALPGSDAFEHMPPDLARSRRAALTQALAEKRTVTILDHRGGLDLRSLIHPFDDGEHVAVVAIDETARNADARALEEANRILQSFLDHLPGAAFVKGHDLRVRIASSGFQRLLGLDPAAMIGRSNEELFPGGFGEKISADDRAILAAGQCVQVQESFSGRYFETIKFPIPRADGPPDLGGITLDITARHEIEEALRQSEERLRQLSDNLPDGFLYQVAETPDGLRRYLYLGSGVTRILGLAPEAVMADRERLYERIHPEQQQAFRAALRAAREGDFAFDARMRDAEGRWHWISLRARQRAQPSAEGARIWDGVATDITARLEAEAWRDREAARTAALLELQGMTHAPMDDAALLAHGLQLARALTGSGEGQVFMVREDQQQLSLAACHGLDLPEAALQGMTFPVLDAGLWGDCVRKHRAAACNDPEGVPQEFGLVEVLAPRGRVACVPVSEDGRVVMLLGVAGKVGEYASVDLETLQLLATELWRIVQRRSLERDLQATRQVVEASPMVCFRWRAEAGWPVEYVSDNIRRWGYEPDALRNGTIRFADLVLPEDLARVSHEVARYTAEGRNAYVQEYRILDADGRVFWVEDSTRVLRDAQGRAAFYDGVLSDIDERKRHAERLTEALATQQALNQRLEEAHNQLLQSETLAAIGQLAAGVAHELNNPIGFVTSNLGTLEDYVHALLAVCDAYSALVDSQHPECPQLAEISRIKRENDYDYLRGDIQPLLAESRDGLLRVRKIVQDLRDFSRSGSQEWAPADLHRGLESTLNIVANELKYKCTVKKEYGELPEVMCVISQINQVFMNLLVNAAQAIEERGEIVLRSGVANDGEHVWVSVSDTGRGISPEHRNRIFEPFFTTKPVGVGTGLGLSLVFGIINRHHGRIEVDSEPGQGSTFRIVLPIRQYQETAASTPGEDKS